MLIFRYKWAFVGDAAAGCIDNNNLSSDFVPHITRIAKLMDNKVNFCNWFYFHRTVNYLRNIIHMIFYNCWGHEKLHWYQIKTITQFSFEDLFEIFLLKILDNLFLLKKMFHRSSFLFVIVSNNRFGQKKSRRTPANIKQRSFFARSTLFFLRS